MPALSDEELGRLVNEYTAVHDIVENTRARLHHIGTDLQKLSNALRVHTPVNVEVKGTCIRVGSTSKETIPRSAMDINTVCELLEALHEAVERERELAGILKDAGYAFTNFA